MCKLQREPAEYKVDVPLLVRVKLHVIDKAKILLNPANL